jgi:hypothetical protein
MDDLPNQSTQSATDNSQPSPVSSGSSSKEVENGIGLATGETPSLTELGKDIELPKEVSAVGVSLSPTVVAIPQNISQMGVKPAGNNVTAGSGQSVTLPLTDDQIEVGLKQNVTTSWRWLAEWCVRQLKHFHIALKNVGGKVVEVREPSN